MFCCLASLANGLAQDVYVSHWGSHEAPFASWETAATNLIDAINVAPSEATVWVTNGIFRTGTADGGGVSSRVVITEPIFVRSVSGSEYTVIEGAPHASFQALGNNAVRAVYMTDGHLEGFTLRRGATRTSGTTAQISGGGLYASGGTQADLRVSGNAGQTAGGAWLEEVSISNAVFSLNTAVTGPRVKINRRVRLSNVRLNNTNQQVPDIRIIGTNGVVLINGQRAPSLDNGTYFAETIAALNTTEHILTVTNQGVRALSVTGISTHGPQATEFSVTNTFPLTVEPGESAGLALQFMPQELGEREALLFVHSNDPDDSPYGVWLKGIGFAAEMQVLGIDESLIVNGETTTDPVVGTDFGLIVEESVRHTFTIANAGDAPLTLTNAPPIVMAGAHPDDFRITSEPDLIIPAGSNTTFELEFMPLAAEERTAIVQIFSDDLFHTNAVYEFAVRGEVAPTNLLFDIQADLVPVGAVSMAWGDFNNNGRMDLAVMGTDGNNRFTDIYENLGNDEFVRIEAGITPLESGDLAWGDFNNNGWLDLAVMGRSDAQPDVTEIYRNNGDGTFTRVLNSSFGLYNGSLAWGDFDNTGKLDLIVTGFDLSQNRIWIYRNNGDETFTRLDTGMQGLRGGNVAWADIRGQGTLDVFLNGTAGGSYGSRHYANNQGTFSLLSATHPIPAAYGGLAFADFSGNGWLDLAMTGIGNTGAVGRVYMHSGSSTPYTDDFTAFTPVWLGDVAVGDFINNGFVDLVATGIAANNQNHFALYENVSGVLMPIDTRIPGMRNASLAFGDFDGDGDLDLAVSGLTTNGYYTAIHRNLTPVTNAPPSAPTGLSATRVNGNHVIFSWDPADDDHTPAQSLSYNLYVGNSENPIAVMSPQADLDTGRRRLSAMGNVQLNTSWTIKGLPEGDIVWGVQAIDGAYAGGPFTAGPPVTIPPLPDLAITDITITEVPFQAIVTVENIGSLASTEPVPMISWPRRTTQAPCGSPGQATNIVAMLDVGEIAQVHIPIERQDVVTTNVFRAFVNSDCAPSMHEARYDNNQLAVTYTNNVYEPFWFQATALSGSVYLRWSDPQKVGLESSDVLIRYSTSAYPTHPNDGLPLPGSPTGQQFHHTGLSQNQTHFYTIWVTNDGSTWIEPPE